MRFIVFLAFLALAFPGQAAEYAAIPRHRAGKYGREVARRMERKARMEVRNVEKVESRAKPLISPKIFIISMV